MATVLDPQIDNEASRQRLMVNDVWPMSVDQYHHLIRTGVLSDSEPIELIEGILVRKMPKHPAHVITTELLRKAIEALIGPDWFVVSQEPITLPTSEPEPDVTVVRGQVRDFAKRHPFPAEIGLVIEVAESSLERDLGWKRKVYAAAGIANYWVADLINQRIEVFSQPISVANSADFQTNQSYGHAQTVPVFLGGQSVGSIRVADVILE